MRLIIRRITLANQKQEAVHMEEVIMSQVYTLQALINVLEKKGLLTREEILAEFHELQKSLANCDCVHDHSH